MKKIFKSTVVLSFFAGSVFLMGCGDTINNYYGESGQLQGEQATYPAEPAMDSGVSQLPNVVEQCMNEFGEIIDCDQNP